MITQEVACQNICLSKHRWSSALFLIEMRFKMRITFSIEAKKYLETLVRADNILVLFYDTEGCGCAVNGVPILKVETEQVKGDLVKINTNDFSVFMYEKHLIFFDDDMRIHFDNNSLRLSSTNQIFTAHLVIKLMEHLL
jgi:uncharacterized protein YqkB